MEFDKQELNHVSGTTSLVNGQLVFARWDSSAVVYDLASKKMLVNQSLGDVCYARPVYHPEDDLLYVPISTKELSCMDTKSGAERWRAPVGKRCSRFDFITPDILLASAKGRGLKALDAQTGKLLYELRYHYETCYAPELSPWPVAAVEDRFFVSNWECNLLTAVESTTGNILWTLPFPEGERSSVGQAIVLGDQLLVGTNKYYKGGALYLINLADGKVTHQEPMEFEERCTPVAYGDQVLFYAYDRSLRLFDVENRSTEVLARFNKANDLSGGQLYPIGNKVYYSDASRELWAFDFETQSIESQGTLKGRIQEAFEWNDTLHVIR